METFVQTCTEISNYFGMYNLLYLIHLASPVSLFRISYSGPPKGCCCCPITVWTCHLPAMINHVHTRSPTLGIGPLLAWHCTSVVFPMKEEERSGEPPGFLQDALSAGKPGWCVIIGGLDLEVIVTLGLRHFI